MTIVPHEWRAAAQVLKILRQHAIEYRERAAQLFVSLAVPGGVGAFVAWAVLPRALARNGATDTLIALSAGVLAFTAIVIGFVVTLMLQTGRVEQHVTLSFEQFQLYAEKLRYMLHSQIVTLMAALLLTGVLILWCVLLVADANAGTLVWIGSLCGGLGMITMLRTFLLPLQIYDLHDFGLEQAKNVKRDQVNRDIKEGRR
ncbi:hypothetical protein [Thermomonas fusca]